MRSILIFCITLSVANIFAQNNAPAPVLPDVLKQFPNVRDFTINPEEDEAYFTALSPVGELSFIIRLQKHDREWKAEIATFSGSKHSDLEPFLSPDGLRLYFASNRPNGANDTTNDFDIWYVERPRKGATWSAPINAGPQVNTTDSEFYPAITSSGNLYFTCSKAGSTTKDDIYLSEWDGEKYLPSVALSTGVNSEGYEFNAYVSPDESFVIFSGYGRQDGFGQGDLYISRKDANGNWAKAENLGPEINSNKLDYCPYVNPVTNTLYFTSKHSEVKRPKDGFTDASAFLKEINKYQNGLSRIYRATLNK